MQDNLYVTFKQVTTHILKTTDANEANTINDIAKNKDDKVNVNVYKQNAVLNIFFCSVFVCFYCATFSGKYNIRLKSASQ